MQYWPHVRASRPYARIRSWKDVTQTKLLAFIGYKAGMTHILLKEQTPGSPRKGLEVATPVTILECPPLIPLAIRFYKKGTYGSKAIADVYSSKTDKELTRKAKPSKKKVEEPKDFDEVRLLVHTQPSKTGLANKKPEVIEVGIGGKTLQEKLAYAKSLLEREVKVSEIVKEGQLVDTKSISKGKGFQGPVKIAGVRIRQHKSEKTKRGVGTLGAWNHQGKCLWRIAHARKHGFHQRTEFNKLIVKMGTNPADVNAKGGFSRFGFLKNEYILIKGSVAGPAKRAVVLTEAARPKTKFKQQTPQVTFISTASKQGL